MKVTLLVDDSGDISGVADASTGASIAFDVQRVITSSSELNPAVSVSCIPATLEPRVRRALNHAITSGGAARVIPLPHCAFDGRSLRGCVHVLPPDGTPSASGWPLDLRYATGISIMELERRLPNGSYMSTEFIKSPEFADRHRAAVAALRVGKGTAPGLMSPGTRALETIRAATSAAHPADPLLRTFRPEPLRSWQPHLRSNDFMRVCSSQWEATHPRTAAAFGHAQGDTHFYVLVCWHLPEEISDQLLQIAAHNPDGQTWAQIAAREEFARAIRISIQARESIVRRYLELATLEPKQSDRRFVHTTADVLVPGTEGPPSFYSGCAPTNLKPDGVLSLSKSDPDAPVFWWSGPQHPDHQGGAPWEMADAMHGMPVVGASLKWNKATLASLAEVGHRIETGYVKLTPLI